MCFKKPKLEQPKPDPEVERMREDAKAAEASRRAEDKKRRTESAIMAAAGRVGTRSLISGGKGGVGFGRSLIGG